MPTKPVLMLCALIMTGCASAPPSVPVAVACPSFPSPPPELMKSPPTLYLLQPLAPKQPSN